MKRFILFIFSIIVFTAHGQTIQYLENNPEWQYSYTGSAGMDMIGGAKNYFLKGDTIIGSKTYKKIFTKGYDYSSGPSTPSQWSSYINTTPSYFFRQENNKLYCIYAGCQFEELLYNFDMNVNDTAKLFSPCDTNSFTMSVVDSVYTILTDTVYRKVLHMSNSINNNCGLGVTPNFKIIEGIGSDIDLFKFCNEEMAGWHLNCYSLNGKSVYPSVGDSCDINMGIKNYSLSENNIIISPNPANDKLTIINNNNHKSIIKLEIDNLYGQKITEQNYSKNI